jgi:predicted ATPase
VLLRLQVTGFKNLLDVDIHFGAFTCVIGANGVGKSNLFDAIRFLQLLAEGKQFSQALQDLRPASGRSVPPESFFTHLGAWRAPRMTMAADMLTASEVVDDFGNPAKAQTRVLRYEIQLGLEAGQLRLEREELGPLKTEEAKQSLVRLGWRDHAGLLSRKRTAYLSTDGAVVSQHQEGHQGRKRRIPIAKSQRTVLGEVSDGVDFPTVHVARREMQSWRTLSLEPSAMRSPSAYTAPSSIDSVGGNVPATLYRLTRDLGHEDAVLARVGNRLHRLLPEVRAIELEDDPRTEQRTVVVRMSDNIRYPARSLSDGTLRFLVIATMAEDPTADGVLCMEEPENGIHPDRVPAIVSLLREVGSVDADGPLRQVVVNTHSPLVHNNAPRADRVWLQRVTALREGASGTVASVAVEAGTWRADAGAALVAPGDAEKWEQMQFHYGEAAEE